MKKYYRPLGDITDDLEPILLELVDQGAQMGEILYLIHGYLMVHAPDCREVYEDGSGSPILYYGPKEGLK